MSEATALIETVRIRNGEAPLGELHLARLRSSCGALGIPLPRDLELPRGGADRVHRLEVSTHGVVVTTRPIGEAAGVRLVTVGAIHRPYPHKTTERAQFEAALAAASAVGADDSVLLTADGWVAETAIFGVFWWEDGRVAAPPLSLGILPGVARARIAALAGGIVERPITAEAVAGRMVFLANSVRGIVPVREIDGRAVARAVGTAELAAVFWG